MLGVTCFPATFLQMQLFAWRAVCLCSGSQGLAFEHTLVTSVCCLWVIGRFANQVSDRNSKPSMLHDVDTGPC